MSADHDRDFFEEKAATELTAIPMSERATEMTTYRVRTLVLAISLALLFGLALRVPAAEASSSCNGTFPATGQTTSFATSTKTPTGAPVGDDGAVQAGGPLSFTDNGDGTITDNNTGLMWEKKSLDGSDHDVNKAFLWSDPNAATIWDWLDALNATSFAGYNDWRIPNVKELHSIVDYEASTSPTVDPAFNNNVVAGCDVFTCSVTAGSVHWTSTTVAAHHDQAILVDFEKDFPGDVFPFFKSKLGGGFPAFVRAVRGCL